MHSYTHEDLIKALDHIERKLNVKLSDVQKILLASDGSITRILEILTNKPVIVETVKRAVIRADEGLAEWFNVNVNSEINYRVVYLKNPHIKRALILAKSWIPLTRLNGEFFNDLTQTDVPLGKIISKHKLEVRREILNINLIAADVDAAKAFQINIKSPLLSRVYNIIHRKAVLMKISEVFPSSSFK
jgi:beta-ribofuranosylaminobenzene 5'-phosphate synthase